MALLQLLLLFPLVSAESLSGTPDREGQRVWSDEGSFARYDLTVFEPKRPTSSWYVVGHRAQNNYNDLSTPIYAIKDNTNNNLLLKAESFTFIWDDRGSTAFDDASAWKAVCPKNYVAVGDFFANVNRRDTAPNELFDKVRCVAQNLTEPCAGWGNKVWDTDGMFGDNKASVWEAVPLARSGLGGFFYVNNDINRPPSVTPLCLKLSAIKFV